MLFRAAIEVACSNNFVKCIGVRMAAVITINELSGRLLTGVVMEQTVPRGLFSVEKVILTPNFLFSK